MEYIELNGGCCNDCVQAIANCDFTGMDARKANKVRAGLERIGEYLVVGEYLGFGHNRCVVCGEFAGDRHQVGYLEALV